jgi:hypothetical protein
MGLIKHQTMEAHMGVECMAPFMTMTLGGGEFCHALLLLASTSFTMPVNQKAGSCSWGALW